MVNLLFEDDVDNEVLEKEANLQYEEKQLDDKEVLKFINEAKLI